MTTSYRIHPTIGIARVGNADPRDRFPGPEIPGLPTELETYHDKKGAIRPQGARFRVFEYEDDHPVREVKRGGDVDKIEWTVHLANKKAYWYKFLGRIGETSPDIDPDEMTFYNSSALRNPMLRQEEIAPDAERREELIIDPKPRSLTADGRKLLRSINLSRRPKKTSGWAGLSAKYKIKRLGTLFVEADGFLTVVGGRGLSVGRSQIRDYANNDTWFDDTSDGPVQAVLHFRDRSKKPVEAAPAWVIVAPPRYAPAIKAVVTLYDAIYDVAVRYHGYRPELFDPERKEFRADYRPSFTKDIYPILHAPELAKWALASVHHVSLASHHDWDYDALANGPPFPNRNSPAAIVGWLRRVEDWNNTATYRQMPRLNGDEDEDVSFLTLTRTQWHVMRQWARGCFQQDWAGRPALPSPQTPITPRGLDEAALENCIGGAFYPGIEAGWILRDPRIYFPHDPFRIQPLRDDQEHIWEHDQEHDAVGLTPGGATMRSALPWQADFFQCVDQWWPSHRPTDVYAKTPQGITSVKWAGHVHSMRDMVDQWSQLPFLLSQKRDGQPPFFI